MEIKIKELFDKEKDITKSYEELKTLILNKKIKFYEFNRKTNKYEFVNNYQVNSIQLWENNQIIFYFGPNEWDICSIQEINLIEIE